MVGVPSAIAAGVFYFLGEWGGPIDVVEAGSGSDAVERSRALEAERNKAPSAVGPVATSAKVPTSRPELDVEGVDEEGFPYGGPDWLGLRALLMAERYTDLDRYLTEFQQEAEEDFHRIGWAKTAFDAFAEPDRAFEPRLAKWIAESPDSFAPYLARAVYRSALSWKLRGSKTVDKTTPQQLKAFAETQAAAERDYRQALKLRPSATPAYPKLLNVLRNRGAPMKEQLAIRDEALKYCPECTDPHWAILSALDPRWGGAPGARKEYIERVIRPQISAHPNLASLEAAIPADKCEALMREGKLAAARKPCDQVVRFVGGTGGRVTRARLAMKDDRLEDALEDLDYVLERFPQWPAALKLRYQVLGRLNRSEEAIVDLVYARQLEPTSDELADWSAESIQWILGESSARYDDGRYEDAERILQLGLKLDPEHRKLLSTLGHIHSKLGVGALEQRVQQNPDDFEAVRDLDHALSAEARYMEVVTMWDDFITRHPDEARAYLERGGTHHHLRHPDQAMEDWKKACEMGVEQGCNLVRRFGGAG